MSETPHQTFALADVRREEAKCIAKRRKNAGYAPTDDAAALLTGIALSGGGIRSAAFSLGALQALYDADMLREFDYLSTVSGGGYVGGYLSSLAVPRGPEMPSGGAAPPSANPGTDSGRETSKSQPHCYDSLLGTRGGGTRQSWRVRRLIHGGQYLRMPWTFLNRHLIGLLAVNSVWLSGLLAAAALAALLFRCLDYPPAIEAATALGFESDVMRALLPAAMAAVLWIGSWGVSWFLASWLHKRPFAALPRFWLIVTTLLLAFAFIGLLVTGDIALSTGGELAHEEVARSEQIGKLVTDFRVALLVVLGIALLPHLRLFDLFRSGTKPRSTVESWVFAVASRALVVGIPLAVFGWFASEDVSGVNAEQRIAKPFTQSFVTDWKTLLTQVSEDARRPKSSSSREPALAIKNALGLTFNSLQEELVNVDRLKKTSLASRWLGYASEPQISQHPLGDLYQALMRSRALRIEAAERINKLLESPSFYQSFALKTASPKPSDDTSQLRDALAVAANIEPIWNVASKDERELLAPRVRDANFQLLRAYFAPMVRDNRTIFAANVIDADQTYRLNAFLLFLLVFVCTAAVVNLNLTSMHAFYRDRLAWMWIARHPRFRRKLQLRGLSVRNGAPYHLINASVNLFQGSKNMQHEAASGFVFSRLFCGSDRTGYERTERYWGGAMDLSDAVAISGAAVSPTTATNPLLLAFLVAMNLRLGQWIPNPGRNNLVSRLFTRTGRYLFPTPLLIGLDWLTSRHAHRRLFCLATDGGHLENLGVEALLKRRCKLIVAIDAGQDGDYQFADLFKLVRRCRALHGIQFVGVDGAERFRLDRITPHRVKKLSVDHFIIARIVYPDAAPADSMIGREDSYLIYVKPCFTGQEPSDLLRYRMENVDFPHDPTLDQFYDPRRFESYRQLGYCIGMKLSHLLRAGCDDAPGEEGPGLGRWIAPASEPAQSMAKQPGARRTQSENSAITETGSERSQRSPAP